jgi:hypothetical protein
LRSPIWTLKLKSYARARILLLVAQAPDGLDVYINEQPSFVIEGRPGVRDHVYPGMIFSISLATFLA